MTEARNLSRLSRLREILVERFSDGELRTLCFDLDVDYDVLPGEGKADKARELVAYLDRRGQSEQIAIAGKRLRPDIDWGGGPASTAQGETAAPTGRSAADRKTGATAIPVPSEWAAREGGITVGGNLEVHGDLAARDIVRDNVSIQAQFGDIAPGAQVALGRQITQIAQSQPEPADPERPTQRQREGSSAEIAHLIAELRDQLAALDLSEKNRVLGQEFVDQLEHELTRTGQPPDASTIKVAGQWLVKNIPPLAGALAGLFLNPIVGKVVEAAGDLAASWVREQFGAGA